MLDETLLKIKSLKAELKKVDGEHAGKARSVETFADAAAHQAARQDRSPDLLKIAVTGLEKSAAEFEASHPKLTAAINEICRELSELGI
jgi:hypothetical protein